MLILDILLKTLRELSSVLRGKSHRDFSFAPGLYNIEINMKKKKVSVKTQQDTSFCKILLQLKMITPFLTFEKVIH